jgi:hypothetical protein
MNMVVNNRQHSAPIVISSPDDAFAQPLQPVPLTEHSISEGRLQELLAKYPNLIPIDEIEPALGPLTCLGREVPTGAGPVDLLYVSPGGYLTLVETKLWRNPEARRAVVGQIIDYAKEIAQWSYKNLDDAVHKALLPDALSGKSIVQILNQQGHDLDEAQFINSVSRNLRRGHFLLLIAGDGIREDVESMTEYLQGTPSLHFSLALLELGLFRLKRDHDWPLLVQPRVVARTAEVVRAVVVVRSPSDAEVEITLPDAEAEPTKVRRHSLTEGSFYDELSSHTEEQEVKGVAQLAARLQDLGVKPRWRASSVSFRLPDPADTGKEFTVVVFHVEGKFYLGWLDQIELSGGYDFEIARRYLQAVVRMTGAKIQKSGTGTLGHDISHLIAKQNEFIVAVKELISQIEAQARNLSK